MNVIPAIDLKDGKCVRLLRGDFANSTKYSDDPVAVARRFANMQTRHLHVVDLDGARDGEQRNASIVQAIAAESGLAIQLGGGIRGRAALVQWLQRGVSRCVIGSLAVTEPDAVKAWFAEFGASRIVLALDVNVADDGTPLVTTHGWTQPSGLSVFECIADFREHGLRHVLCTDVRRDGAMAGPNLELYRNILARYPDIELQASGGVRSIQDLQALRDAGIPAAITGRALLDGKIRAEEVASFQQNA